MHEHDSIQQNGLGLLTYDRVGFSVHCTVLGKFCLFYEIDGGRWVNDFI